MQHTSHTQVIFADSAEEAKEKYLALGIKRNNFTIRGATIEPTMPVKITAAMLMGTIPPNCSVTPMAIGVVTDLLNREAVSVCAVGVFIRNIIIGMYFHKIEGLPLFFCKIYFVNSYFF